MMITKSALKFIKSLQLKKNRIEHQCFLVEGIKSVEELMKSNFEIDFITGSQDYVEAHKSLLNGLDVRLIKPSDINNVSSFKSNSSVIAVAKMRQEEKLIISNDKFVLALDDVRDPGNLGTIIRIADWYGIDQILASKSTAELYNPKVISASMGSFTRVRMNYIDLEDELQSYNGNIYGALMEGNSLHDVSFGSAGIIVMGNESVGISDSIQKIVTDRITIPKYGSAESLNVGIAAAIICDRMRSSK